MNDNNEKSHVVLSDLLEEIVSELSATAVGRKVA